MGTHHRFINSKPDVDENLLKELFRNEGQVDSVEVFWCIFF